MTNPVESLATLPFAAPVEDQDNQAPQSYRLGKPFAAVQFDADAKGRIVFLPAGAEVRIVGPSALCKCVEALCGNRRYNIFQQDLLGPWSTRVKKRSNRPVPARSVAACA